VAGALADGDERPRIAHLAVRDMPGSGSPEELLAWAGIDAAHIADAARELVRATRGEPARAS
jgi:transketolase